MRPLLFALALAALLVPGAARSGTFAGTTLAVPMLEPGGVPRLVLAQRTITRSWGPSDDSVYVETSIPEWRSEGFAAAGSALVPGAGQLYVGETGGALWFALTEAAGWTARFIFKQRSADSREVAVGFAGDPGDSASAWSFERWEASTAGDAADLRRLYDADRDAFYHRLANDPSYAAGWKGAGESTRLEFRSSYDRSQRFARRARRAGEALWLNHLVAAVEALRAARMHNLTLAPGTQLQLQSSWRHGPALRATVERRF